MNNSSGYEAYFKENSNEKEGGDHNFGIDSFDMNNPSEGPNKTIGSGKKENENSSNIYNSKLPNKDIISESQELNYVDNKINTPTIENDISQKTEKGKEKEKEKEKVNNSLQKKTTISKVKRNSKNNFIGPPNISRISDLNFDYKKYDENILSQIEKEYYEKTIEQLKNENNKLIEQYEKEFKKECEDVENLKEQHRKDLDKIRNATEKKIEQLVKRRELIENNLENEKKKTEEIIAQKEENIKQINKKKEELKQMEIDNQIEILKKQQEYEINSKRDELEREKENEEKLSENYKNKHKYIDELFNLLKQHKDTEEKIQIIVQKNEELNQDIKNKENEIEIQNKLLLNKKEEFDSIQNENQRRILELKDILLHEKKRINELERSVKKEEINFNEDFEKQQLELKYKKMGYDMQLEIKRNRLENRKNEIEREKKKLEDNQIHLINYQKKENMYLEHQENEINKRKKNIEEKKLLILSKRNIIEDKKKYILQMNENNRKEKEEIMLEKQKLEKDKNDIKIALERIQIIINNLNEEKRKIDIEKINTMKIYQELENRKAQLIHQKQKLNYQNYNINENVESGNKFTFNKYNYFDDSKKANNFGKKISPNTSSKQNSNTNNVQNNKKFNAEEYFNNLMNGMKKQ